MKNGERGPQMDAERTQMESMILRKKGKKTGSAELTDGRKSRGRMAKTLCLKSG